MVSGEKEDFNWIFDEPVVSSDSQRSRRSRRYRIDIEISFVHHESYFEPKQYFVRKLAASVLYIRSIFKTQCSGYPGTSGRIRLY